MDREKQKKLEKERMEKERAEMAHEEKDKGAAVEEGDEIRVPRKSKFVSVRYMCPAPHPVHHLHTVHCIKRAHRIQSHMVGMSHTLPCTAEELAQPVG